MKEGDILMEQLHKGRQAFSYAFPIMIPMGISFFFIGLGFGLYATSQGFPWWTPPVLAVMVVIFSTVYLRYNDMFIWVGSGFLPLLGCVMKVLLSICLQDCPMM